MKFFWWDHVLDLGITIGRGFALLNASSCCYYYCYCGPF